MRSSLTPWIWATRVITPIAALYATEYIMLCARAIMVIRNYLKKVGKEAAELTSKLIN